MNSETGLSKEIQREAYQKRKRNKHIGIILAFLIIIVGSLFTFKVLNSHKKVSMTPYTPKKAVAACYKENSDIDQFVHCLSTSSKTIANMDPVTQQSIAKSLIGLMTIKGNATSYNKTLELDLYNKTDYKYNVIKIQITCKNSDNEQLWKHTFTVDHAKIEPQKKTTVLLSIKTTMFNYEWAITHLE